MDIILEFFFKLFKPDRKVSLRKVGLYITDLLTQLEGLQYTIKTSDLKDQLPPTFSENLGMTINKIDRILFKIETSSANKYISEREAEEFIAGFQKMKRQTKKAYIDLGYLGKSRSTCDQEAEPAVGGADEDALFYGTNIRGLSLSPPTSGCARDQDLLDLLNRVNQTLNQVLLSGQMKHTFNEADDIPPKVPLGQREPALM